MLVRKSKTACMILPEFWLGKDVMIPDKSISSSDFLSIIICSSPKMNRMEIDFRLYVYIELLLQYVLRGRGAR